MISKVKAYFQEVWQELKKVSWSTRDELVYSTIVVIVSVAILGAFVGVTDFFFSYLIKFVIR